MIENVQKEACKKVPTYAVGTKQENGYLIELFTEGDQTVVYLTATFPKSFKGYHLHQVRRGRMICLRGRLKFTIVEGQKKIEHILDAAMPERLTLPTNVYIGIENIGDEEAWLVNFPDPPYDPSLKDEQLEKTPAAIEEQLKGV